MPTKARWDSLTTDRGFAIISFDDIDEPIYPMVGDEFQLHDVNAKSEITAIVVMVNWFKRLIYLELNWASAIDVVE
jgi:hypothetical protein